ncbi:hypothetical protein NK6_1086 [Bradyrhizobium diazoefficiens]|uniref:Uncharacterized protein n=1 Tax=Bradyrhizobium diazoefficiens TaxID=1355477 RepID=A0A0E4BK83_9BRAD|nr:hypothetical protein NK6_1086 [Bradyrhizobium diazoefficiens]
MRRSNDISLESTGSCPRGTRREAIADSPAIWKTAPAATPMSIWVGPIAEHPHTIAREAAVAMTPHYRRSPL